MEYCGKPGMGAVGGNGAWEKPRCVSSTKAAIWGRVSLYYGKWAGGISNNMTLLGNAILYIAMAFYTKH